MTAGGEQVSNQSVSELQQRIMVFSKAFQDLIREISKLVDENTLLKQELAKAKIELKHDEATKRGSKKSDH